VNAIAKWVADAWAEEFKGVLQFLTGEDWTAGISEPEPVGSAGSCYWWTQRFNVAPGARVSVGAPALAWSELGARTLQAAGVELIEQSSARSTYLEAVQQSVSALARALAVRLSRPVEPAGGKEEAPEKEGHAFTVTIASGGLELPSLRLLVSEELCWAFQPQGAIVPVLYEEAKSVTASNPVSRTMSVLLDVQMPVSISFGHASMPLRDVMKLAAGSAVELDRKPDDHVDVIVNNCVIARGEVVVIEGNYGVRITEIISREQRLALRGGARAC
jgi:flagellar motor switch protein FliN